MKLEDLDSQLEKNHLSGFWRTRVPSHSSEAPYLWKWEALLDGLLKASETIGIDGFTFQILRADSRKVHSLLVEKPKPRETQ